MLELMVEPNDLVRKLLAQAQPAMGLRHRASSTVASVHAVASYIWIYKRVQTHALAKMWSVRGFK